MEGGRQPRPSWVPYFVQDIGALGLTLINFRVNPVWKLVSRGWR